MNRPPAGRLVALLLAMAFAFTGIVSRLAVLQARDGETFEQMGFDQRVRTIALPADRGQILDRARTPLAITLEARDVYADPTKVTDPQAEALKIAPVLEMKVWEVRQRLQAEGQFSFVARQVDRDAADRIDAMHLAGIGILPVPKRFYPAGNLAAQVLGFVGVDGQGLSGLEDQYDDVLAGTPGERTAEVSPDGLTIAQGVDVVTAPQPGRDLVTTLVRDLQYFAQIQLKAAVEANHALGGTLIVMDPITGDIYAMATYPWFDPNRYATYDQARFRNRAVTDSFEPGSVNKVITAAAAVQERAFPLNHRFTVPDHTQVDDYTIHDSHAHATEQMTLGDIVAESSNVGAVRVANTVGASRLSAYLSRFGFGEPTGLGFPGETGGIVPSLSQWSEASLATIAYGQGVSVTTLQMASVYATIANGGRYVRPRLVRGTLDADGAFDPAPASPTRRVVSADTAETVTEMLASAVADGTGSAAQIAGYQVAGKTGTALKPDPETGGYSQRYVASFIGFLPASQPRVVVAAILDEPSTIYGGIAAAPLFQKVARYAIQRLGIAAAPDVGVPPHALNRG
ncbi:MAG TPA: penicillin-binding protein 2 [Actinomycetota bacterium]|jgi:cell division protein FtsI (penicillin-binding protein 3)|nr:penicillin-binding protein 2 [Actinomycetota bacterium]